MRRFQRAIRSITDAEPEEVRPLCWAFLYFFLLLCGYYLLRPVREEMAIEGGVKHLPWMMTATFVTLMFATPVFGLLSARVSRYRLLLTVYAFFAVNLIGFYLLSAGQVAPVWIARGFFVWLSVFNLFVVSVFWSFMADVFTPAQGVRLFGVIAAGGSSGAMAGPLLATWVTFVAPISSLMLLSVGFLAACCFCMSRLDRWSKHQPILPTGDRGEPIGGNMWAGVRLALSSPYLLGICGYLFLLSTTATFLYLEQMKLVGEQVPTPEARTRLFAMMDFAVNVITFLTQIFVTGRLIGRFGLASGLIVLPVGSAVGFSMIGFAPVLALFILFTVFRRIAEYGITKPSREVLFTVLSREEKYKSKTFIDTAISRGGDAVTGWAVNGVKSLGVTASEIAWFLVPITCAWSWLGWSLAHEEERKQTAKASDR